MIREYVIIIVYHFYLELVWFELIIFFIVKVFEVVRWFFGIEFLVFVVMVVVVREVVGLVGGGIEGDMYGEGVDGRGVVVCCMWRFEGVIG